MKRRTLAGLGVLGTLCAGTSPAEAHLVTTGLGPVYDGIAHVLLTPEDLVPVVALALLAGLRGKDHARSVLLAFPLAWLVGGLAGTLVGHGPGPAIAAASFLAIGGLVASDARIPLPATVALACAVGALHGLINGTGGAGAQLGLRGLLGIAATAFVIVALVAAVVLSLRPAWTRIAVRVLGSWIAASGMLLVGWSLRAGATIP